MHKLVFNKLSLVDLDLKKTMVGGETVLITIPVASTVTTLHFGYPRIGNSAIKNFAAFLVDNNTKVLRQIK